MPGPSVSLSRCGLLHGAREPEAVWRERARAGRLRLLQLGVVLLGVGGVDDRGLDGHGTVEVDGQARDAVAPFQAPQLVEDLLGSPHGEGRNQEPALLLGGPPDGGGQPGRRVAGRMQPVAIGGLHEQDVGLGHRIGIHHDGNAVASEVAGEDEPPSADHALHDGRAEDVAGMHEPGFDAGRRCEARAPVHALDQGQRAVRVGRGEERQGRIVATRPVTVGEARLFLLQMRRVRQQDLEQIGGAARAIHGTAEAVPDEPRQVARVIDVRMAQDNGGERAGFERRARPVPQAQGLEPLEEPAVEQESAVAVLEQMLGAGDGAARGPEEGQGCARGHWHGVYDRRRTTVTVESSSGAAVPHRGGRIPAPPHSSSPRLRCYVPPGVAPWLHSSKMVTKGAGQCKSAI